MDRADMSDPKAAQGPHDHVYVEVSGLTGSGKSAVMGEIEIALKALGLTVEHDAGFQAEKNATHADWQEALDLYRPTVILSECNISRAQPPQAGAGDALRIIENLSNLRGQFEQIAALHPNDQPHYPNGVRPFGTGDLRHFIASLTEALAALSAGTVSACRRDRPP